MDNTLEFRIYLDKKKTLIRITGNVRDHIIRCKILCHREPRKRQRSEMRVDQESLKQSLLSVQSGLFLRVELVYTRIIILNSDEIISLLQLAEYSKCTLEC